MDGFLRIVWLENQFSVALRSRSLSSLKYTSAEEVFFVRVCVCGGKGWVWGVQ